MLRISPVIVMLWSPRRSVLCSGEASRGVSERGAWCPEVSLRWFRVRLSVSEAGREGGRERTSMQHTCDPPETTIKKMLHFIFPSTHHLLELVSVTEHIPATAS